MKKELLAKIKRIEISTRKRMTDLLTGGYKSRFKGLGMQFAEHRVYTAGDDIRHLDWKVSARVRDPLIKTYEEEREKTVFLIVDLSASQDFGSGDQRKRDTAADLTALIAHAATTTGDRVGALLVSESVKKIIPPKKGRSQILRLVHEVLSLPSTPGGTGLSEACAETLRLLKHTGVVFILSDFRSELSVAELRRISRRHDGIGISIQDPKELHFPDGVSLQLEDPETGIFAHIDGQAHALRQWAQGLAKSERQRVEALHRNSSIDYLEISTVGSPANALVNFFSERKRRAGGR